MAEITLTVRAAPMAITVSGAQGPSSGGGAVVSDTAYDATSWNGVTTIAPSKNAVRDKVETLAPAVGSPSIVTLGTVTTGTWQGTAIGDTYISSAATWNAKQAAISFGTGVQTALGVNVGSAGAPVLFNGDGGTPSSIVLTNATGTASGLTAGAVTGLSIGGGSSYISTGSGSQINFGVGNLFITEGAFTCQINVTANTIATLPSGSVTLLASGGALGTPSSGTLTSCTGLPVSTGVSGLGTTVASSLAETINTTNGFVTQTGGDARYARLLSATLVADESGDQNTTTLKTSATLILPLEIGTYDIESIVIQNCNSTAAGSRQKLNFSGTSSSFAGVTYAVDNGTTTSTSSPFQSRQVGVALSAERAASGSSIAAVRIGRIVVTVAGNLAIQFAQQTATPATSPTLVAGSYLRAFRIP